MAPRRLGDGQTDGIIEPDQLARTVVETLREERFYVLPHPEVEEYVRRKGDDVDRWLLGMRRLRRRSVDEGDDCAGGVAAAEGGLARSVSRPARSVCAHSVIILRASVLLVTEFCHVIRP
jgi:hypothetical protein